MFTEYLYDKKAVQAQIVKSMATLKRTQKTDDWLGFAVPFVSRWLKRDPSHYLEFGPYWWAFKKLLIAKGLANGTAMDEEVAAVYKGETDIETLAMCAKFMDFYRSYFFVGTRTFMLDPDDPVPYRLYDPDYE